MIYVREYISVLRIICIIVAIFTLITLVTDGFKFKRYRK